MLLKADRDELLRALGLISGVPLSKSDIPILSHLVLTAGMADASLRGTDTEMDVSAPFAAEVSQPGQVCVGAKLLFNIVKRLPEKQPVSLTLKDGKLRIVCGRSRFDLSVLPAEDYPSFAAQGSVSGRIWRFEVWGDLFRRMLSGVRHTMSKEETRYYLCGVYLHVTQDEPAKLKAVATNGHQLALQSLLAPVGAHDMPGIIIPSGAVVEMLKLLPDESELVTVSVSERFVWLDFPDGLAMGSKLIDGTYPDYMRVVPQGNEHYVRCEADVLAAAIDRVTTVASEHKEVSLCIERSGLSVICENTSIGVGRDRLDKLEVGGPKRLLSFNHRYISGMLANYAGATVELRYANAETPVLITMVGSDTGLQVLMPMRTASTYALNELEAAA
jgi:DNA polymerase-3 subunit beta